MQRLPKREGKNITVEKMAKDLNENQSRIMRIENGKTEMLVSEFLRWCEYFEVSPRVLFDNENYPYKKLRYKRVYEKNRRFRGRRF